MLVVFFFGIGGASDGSWACSSLEESPRDPLGRTSAYRDESSAGSFLESLLWSFPLAAIETRKLEIIPMGLFIAEGMCLWDRLESGGVVKLPSGFVAVG